jgi:hypothetical protein
MRTFIICAHDHIKENEAGGRQEIPTKFYSENLKTRDRLGDLGVFHKMIIIMDPNGAQGC